MAVGNALAYCDTATIMTVRSFIMQPPDHQHKRNISRSVANPIKLFDHVIYDLNQCSNVLHLGMQLYAIEQHELDTNAGKQLS
jgi:hypothetical protein